MGTRSDLFDLFDLFDFMEEIGEKDEISIESMRTNDDSTVLMITINNKITIAIPDDNPLDPDMIGIARLNPCDKYCKKIGQSIAYARAKGLKPNNDKVKY